MVSLKFHCQDDLNDFIEVESDNFSNGLFITIVEKEVAKCIHLDKQTAIKFSKEIRKQIALLN